MTNTTKTVLKLGDKVSATYGNSTAVGIIDSFVGGWVGLKLTQPCDMGFRVETDVLSIDPGRRNTIKLIASGPALTEGEIVELPGWAAGGGPALTTEAAAARLATTVAAAHAPSCVRFSGYAGTENDCTCGMA